MTTPTMVTINGDLAPDLGATSITFKVPANVAVRYNNGPDVILPLTKYTVTVAANGTFSLPVPGTNDPNWSPSNWTLEVVVLGDDLFWEFDVQVPYDAGTLNFSSLLPAVEASEGTLYAAFNHSHGGGGGSVAWVDITGKPSTFPPTVPIAQSGITNLVSDLGGKAPTSHTHTASQVTDFTEAVQDVVGGFLTQGSNVTLTYNDAGNTLTIASSGGGGGGVAPTFARAIVTSGDTTTAAQAAFGLVAGGPTISIAAVAGDSIKLDVAGMIDYLGSTADYHDLVVIGAGSSIVRCASSGTATPSAEGDPALYPDIDVRFRGYSTFMSFVATSGDIVGGNITFGFIHKGAAGGSKIFASAAYPLRFDVSNFKQ